jgi:O-antigen ligase
MVSRTALITPMVSLFAGTLIGILAIGISVPLVLGICLFGLLVLFGCARPALFAVVIAFLLPLYLEWETMGTGMKVGATSLLVVGTLVTVLIYSFAHRGIRLLQIPHLVPWMLLSGFMCAAFIHGPYFVSDPAKIPWYLYRTVLRYLLIYPLLLLVFRIEGEHAVRNVVMAVLVSTGLVALVAIAQTALNVPWHPLHFGIALKVLITRWDAMTYDSGSGILRAFGSFAHPNGLAGFLVVVIPISFAIILLGRRDVLWYTAAVSGLFQIIALACTMSRGGWIATVISFLIMFSMARQKRVILLGVTFLLLFGVMAALFSPKALTSRIATLSSYSQIEELAFREGRWESFLEIARANPLLGTGEATLDDSEEGDSEVGQTPHNLYLFFAVKYGVPALLLLAYLWGRLIYESIQGFRLSTVAFHRAIALGVAGSGIGLCIHGLVDALMDTDQIWTAFWILLAMSVVLKEWTMASPLGVAGNTMHGLQKQTVG